jgi:hypothetical protein
VAAATGRDAWCSSGSQVTRKTRSASAMRASASPRPAQPTASSASTLSLIGALVSTSTSARGRPPRGSGLPSDDIPRDILTRQRALLGTSGRRPSADDVPGHRRPNIGPSSPRDQLWDLAGPSGTRAAAAVPDVYGGARELAVANSEGPSLSPSPSLPAAVSASNAHRVWPGKLVGTLWTEEWGEVEVGVMARGVEVGVRRRLG